MGRPSKFTAERRQKLLDGRRLGLSGETCAGLAGIGETTLREWLERGRKEDVGPYADFHVEWLQASAEPRQYLAAIVYDAARDRPELALKALERLEPNYRLPDRNGPVFAPVTMIELDLGDRPRSGELVEGRVIDVTQESSRPGRLPAGSGPAAGKAS